MSVLVLGMHRSGTSVATRMVSLLGLSVCAAEDLSTDRRGNERGVWESAPLVRLNDEVLAAAGGAWWCPPPADHDWSPQVKALGETARTAFSSSHRGARWVWKDPRTCLTLPFWMAALGIRPAVIVMLRDPLDVAASLTTRNQFSTSAGIALWERSLRALVRQLSGLPVLVTRYDALVGDPGEWCSTTARFLADTGHPCDTTRALLASDYVSRPRRRGASVPQGAAEHPADPLSPSQRHLRLVLEHLVGTHARFAVPDLGAESPATEAFFAEQRRTHGLASSARVPASIPSSGLTLFASSPPPPRRTTTPDTTVVVITRDEGQRLADTVDCLTATTPANVEVVVVDDVSRDGSLDRLPPHPRVRVIRATEPLGISRARNLGATGATGDLLVFSDAHVAPAAGWLAAVADALEQPTAGAVSPLLAPFGEAHTVNGLTFEGPQLNVRWLSEPARRTPFAVPLVAGCFLAVRREVFEAAGGFDDGMSGYGAEDLELCLRLWRLGYECLSVPGARVEHRFKPVHEQRVDRTGFLHNLLRLGSLHLTPWRLETLVAAMRHQPEFAGALAQVLVGDIGERRAETAALSWYGDDTFFARFGPACYAAPPPTSSRSPEEVA